MCQGQNHGSTTSGFSNNMKHLPPSSLQTPLPPPLTTSSPAIYTNGHNTGAQTYVSVHVQDTCAVVLLDGDTQSSIPPTCSSVSVFDSAEKIHRMNTASSTATGSTRNSFSPAFRSSTAPTFTITSNSSTAAK